MRIQKQELLNKLKSIKPGLASKEIIEHSNSFCFDSDKIVTYNDEVSVEAPFESGITGAIRGAEFYKTVDKFPADSIRLQQKDNQLIISSKKAKASFNIEEFNLPEISSPKKWKNLPEDFKEAVNLCSLSASKSMAKPALTCLYFNGTEVRSCDNYRVSIYSSSSEFPLAMLLPAAAALNLCSHDVVKYNVSDQWIHFKTKEDIVFHCRSIQDEFPHEDEINPFFKFKATRNVDLPISLPDMIERAEIMDDSEFDIDKAIQLTLTGNALICKGQGNIGWFEEKEQLDYSGPDVTIQIHPRLLTEILHISNKIRIGQDKVIFKSSKFKHVISLVEE